jgi:hypothetical protein
VAVTIADVNYQPEPSEDDGGKQKICEHVISLC